MAATYRFTSDNLGDPEPVVVQSVCRVVRIRHNDLDNAAITFYTYVPDKNALAVLHPANEVVEFPNHRFWQPGDVVAYVSTATGSVEFAQEEDN